MGSQRLGSCDRIGTESARYRHPDMPMLAHIVHSPWGRDLIHYPNAETGQSLSVGPETKQRMKEREKRMPLATTIYQISK